MAEKRKPDFTGWATKYGIKCTDGRTILPGAFKDMDGKKVPIVWGHIHDDPDMVLGHAILYNRPEGIWTEGFLNNNPKSQSTKETLRNGDVDGLSIYANELKHVNGREVEHGNIRELSVVLAGANKGATIENVLLAHDDLMYEPDDECIVYNDDEPLWHAEDEAKVQKKKKDEEPEAEEEEETEEAEEEASEEKEEENEDMTDEEKKLAHADVDGDGEEDDPQQIWDSMSKKQQDLCSYLVARAAEGEDGGEDNNEEDAEMKHNVFENDNQTPETYLSHEDQKKIIDRAVKLGSMKDAWEEALETNDTLSHAVFNDDGTEQTYGIANIDYLFPDYYELNDRPDFIRRPDDWVNVVLNGVYKTPKARLRTTHANITMDEARAKGYVKGTQKAEEVFNLLRRTVDPQTIYKKQKFDRDDIIDIDDFDVIAWVKVEMRDMLNEEIARAILVGDGRAVSDPDKIFESHIKPIVNDDDLYAVKIGVVKGQTDADTAKNAIRAMIKGRKFYKGSGNMVFFTSEDWLSEWLLLEDNFGHELYKDASELAKKMRVNRIVTCPFFEGLTNADGKEIYGIAVDLKDYATGTNRRGQVEFFDDFDIDFNQYKYLIETRLSGMLRKPYSAMVLTESANGAPYTYEEVTPVGSENPKSEGWYEKEGSVFRRSADATVKNGKTYYEREEENLQSSQELEQN